MYIYSGSWSTFDSPQTSVSCADICCWETGGLISGSKKHQFGSKNSTTYPVS